MINPSSLFTGPALVIIDAQRKTYARYFGVKHTMTVRGTELLSAHDVEAYRVDPHDFMDIDPSEAA